MNACIEQECEKVAFERWQQQTNDERNENNKHTPRTWTTCYWRMKAHTTATTTADELWMTTMEKQPISCWLYVLYTVCTYIINIHWAWISFILISISFSDMFDHVLLFYLFGDVRNYFFFLVHVFVVFMCIIV